MRVFKNVSVIALIALLITFVAGPAFATDYGCNNGSCERKTYSNNASSMDASQADTYVSDFSKSSKYGNDTASAQAGSHADSAYSAYSGGKNGLIVNGAGGEEKSNSASTVDTLAKDFGKTSVAGGYAATKSNGQADAWALGGGIGYRPEGVARTEAAANVNGSVWQGHDAAETGYNGANATAGNKSEASYSGSVKDADCDLEDGRFAASWGNKSDVDLTGIAKTGGFSTVTVDPDGSYKSATGKTGNFAYADVDGTRHQDTDVSGQGGVSTQSYIGNPSNGGYSEGGSSFGYNNDNFGMGGAEHTSFATMNASCDGNTVTSSAGSAGSAFSFSK